MARHVFSSLTVSIDARFAMLKHDPSPMSIDARFALLMETPSRQVSKHALGERSSPRDIYIATIGNRFKNLSTKELQYLTGRDTIRTHPSAIKSSYRNALIVEAKECLHRMTDDHLLKIYQCGPFTVSFESYELRSRQISRQDDSEDERDWDCRPSTIGEVTEEDLDRELDEYFRQDPERYMARLDAELAEYMSGRETATSLCDSENES